MKTLLLLVLAVVGLWFYFSRMRERVTARARVICKQSGFQLLDQTVALKKIHMPASIAEVTRPLIEYHFEISHDGLDRCKASAFLVNQRIIQVIVFHPGGNTIIHDIRTSGDHKPEKLTGET